MGDWAKYLKKVSAKTKSSSADILAGGKADDKPNSDFSAQQLAMGRKVEREHSDSEDLAEEIARDHLEEIPDYYTRLKKMEDGAKKQAASSSPVGVVAGNQMMWVPRDAAMKTFANNPPGAVERHATGAGAVGGATLGAAGMGLLARRARLGGLGTGLATAAGVLGGGSLGGLTGASAARMSRAARGQENLKELAKHQVAPPQPTKTAALLDKALGSLYTKHGPPLQKHAAAEFFFYSLEKEANDKNALGLPFCKLAAASGMDPWVMAKNIVSAYPQLVKMASARTQEGELARFYLSWANEMVKKAGLLDAGIRGIRAAKAGLGAAIPKSSTRLMDEAIRATEAGRPIPGPRQGVLQAMKGSLAETKALQQAGGGSIRRGEQLAKADPELLNITRQPVMHPGTPPAPAGGAAAGAKPGVSVKQAPAEAVQLGDYLRGAAVVGGLGLGGAAMMGAGQPEQQPYYGESYA